MPDTRGTISYAQYEPADRTTNLFVNLSGNPKLDRIRKIRVRPRPAGRP